MARGSRHAEPQEAAEESTSQMRWYRRSIERSAAELKSPRCPPRAARPRIVSPQQPRARGRADDWRPAAQDMNHAGLARKISPFQRGPRDNGSAASLPPPAIRRQAAPPQMRVSGACRRGSGRLALRLRTQRRRQRRARETRHTARLIRGKFRGSRWALDMRWLVDRETASEMWERYQRGQRTAH